METYNYILLWILFIFSILWCINSFIILFKLNKQELMVRNITTKIVQDATNPNEMNTDLSNQILQFTRMIISQIAMMKYRDFVDSKDMSKITRSNVTKLVDEVATECHKAIRIESISFESLVFTREFYEQYIVETTVFVIKSMVNKTFDNIEDDSNDNKELKDSVFYI